jgi:hypothetical protein
MPDPIATPGGYVTPSAIAYAASAHAMLVDLDHPLPVGERPFQGAAPITPGVDEAPGRAIAIQCAVPGAVSLKLANDSQFTLPVETGLSIFPLAVKTVVASGTTAVASYANLI